MSEDSIDNIELIEQPIEAEESIASEPTGEANEQLSTPTAAETKEEAVTEIKSEEKEKSLEELPLPGDEAPDTKTLPKWVAKKLSRKDQELQQKAHETEMYKAELARVQAQSTYVPQANQWVDPELPKRESYGDEGQYISAVVAHTNRREQEKAQIIAQQQGMQNAENSFQERYREAQNLGAEKYEDFEEKVAVLNTDAFPRNRAMAEAIVDSAYKSDILYFLASNVEEARNIALLNPVQAVKKIAAIEARFEARKKTSASKAPPPIESLKTNSVKGSTIDNLEQLVKNSEKMSQAEFEANYAKLTANTSVAW